MSGAGQEGYLLILNQDTATVLHYQVIITDGTTGTDNIIETHTQGSVFH